MDMIITFPGGARVDAQFGSHTVHTDQPAQGGGEDSAATPFATFLASIGTCAGIYVLGFCRQRGLPTEGIRLTQRTIRNPTTGLLDLIQIDIHVPPDFPDKYYPALVRSADQCLVKKTMEHPPSFEVKTVVDGATSHSAND